MAITDQGPSEFDVARKRAQQQTQSAVQAQKEALMRRAAQTGGGINGALMKQESLVDDQAQRQLGEANEAIGAAERSETRRAGEFQKTLDLQRYGIDTQKETANKGLELQRYGIDTQASTTRYGIDTNKELSAAQLTGTYQGKDTLAKTTAAQQAALAEAGLTGVYKGQKTVQGQALDDARQQQALENKINAPTTLVTLLSNLKQVGLTPEAIADINDLIGPVLQEIGLDPGLIAATPGLTTAAPEKPKPAPKAKPAAPIDPYTGKPMKTDPMGRPIDPYTGRPAPRYRK